MIGDLFSIYKTSPVSASISPELYPLVNATLSTVVVELEGVAVTPELCPVITFVPEKAVRLPLLSIPSSLNLVCI